MPWVVIRDDQEPERFDDWHDAADHYRSLVLEWERLENAFEEVVTGKEPVCGGWAWTREADAEMLAEHFGEEYVDELTPGHTQHVDLLRQICRCLHFC
jgi:hypothetical protein